MAKPFQAGLGDGSYVNQTTNIAAGIGSGSYLLQSAQAGHAKPGNQGGHVPPIAPPPRPLVRSLVSSMLFSPERRRRLATPGSSLQKLPGQ